MRLSVWKWAGAVVLISPIAMWYYEYDQGQERIGLWSAQVYPSAEARLDALASATPGDVPARAHLLLDYAVFQGEQVFPPDYGRADPAVVRALLLNPLDSQIWLQLARQRYYLRQLDAARVALTRSDSLSPGYTVERLESLELRELMGDREAVLSVARKVAATHPANAVKAAQYLTSLGVPSTDILAATCSPDTPPEEIARLLESLTPANDAEAEALLAAVIQDFPPDPMVQRAGLRIAVKAKAPVAINNLWEMLARIPVAPIPGTANLQMIDPALGTDPEDNRSPLGWQITRSESNVAVAWQPGVLRATFESTVDESQRTTRFRFLRIPVPPSASPTQWRISVGSNEPLRSRIQLLANDGSKTYRSSITRISEPSGTVVGLEVAAADELRIVELSIERIRDGSSAAEGVFVELGSLQIDQAPAAQEEAP